jgi:hypothetical protein
VLRHAIHGAESIDPKGEFFISTDEQKEAIVGYVPKNNKNNKKTKNQKKQKKKQKQNKTKNQTKNQKK